jgi:hypothetical protein
MARAASLPCAVERAGADRVGNLARGCSSSPSSCALKDAPAHRLPPVMILMAVEHRANSGDQSLSALSLSSWKAQHAVLTSSSASSNAYRQLRHAQRASLDRPQKLSRRHGAIAAVARSVMGRVAVLQHDHRRSGREFHICVNAARGIGGYILRGRQPG